MKMTKLSAILLVILALVGSQSLFTVHERERAILFQLGKIVSSDYESGLYFKLPIVQNVIKFDGRIQTLDAEPALFLTGESKNVLVDSFVKWRISDVERFYTAAGGSISNANLKLTQFVTKALKDEFGQRSISQVVSGERAEMMEKLMGRIKNSDEEASKTEEETLREKAAALGVEIVDVRLKRVDFSEKISNSVYRRMQTERQRIAREHRAKGHEEAKRIRATADKEREVILAEAERDAQLLRGEGDAIAADTYARAYSADEEFYAFYRSLIAYKKSFNNKQDVLLLGTDNEFFRFFKDAGGK